MPRAAFIWVPIVPLSDHRDDDGGDISEELLIALPRPHHTSQPTWHHAHRVRRFCELVTHAFFSVAPLGSDVMLCALVTTKQYNIYSYGA